MQGTAVPFRSEQYYVLVERAIRAKVDQHREAREVLKSTGTRMLIHDTGREESPRTSLPAARFIEILTRIRAELLTSE